MNVIVTGAGGLVGRAVVSAFRARGEVVAGFNHESLDITSESAVRRTIEPASPDVVINCAAWTDVDGCESHPELATRVNAEGPELLARACRNIGALFITISTDYVFDGEKDGFYTQRDQPNPQSVYAASKLEGERRVQNVWARSLIVRSGYIFGAGGTNFLSTFIDRVHRGERLKVINDCFGTPTYAPHLAERLHRLAQMDLPGLYHVVNSGPGASFTEFTGQTCALMGWGSTLLEPVSLDSLPRPARRPRNSRLHCLVSAAVGLEPMPLWTSALGEFLAAIPAPQQPQPS